MRINVLSEYKTYSYEWDAVEPITIGRSESNDFSVPHDELSRKHCQVYFENNEFYIVDLGSKNGVKVNGERIEPNVKVLINESSVVFLAKDLQMELVTKATRTKLKLEEHVPSVPKPSAVRINKKYKVMK